MTNKTDEDIEIESRVLVESIAKMKKDGELGEDGVEYIQENDDAVDTLQSLISVAREITGK